MFRARFIGLTSRALWKEEIKQRSSRTMRSIQSKSNGSIHFIEKPVNQQLLLHCQIVSILYANEGFIERTIILHNVNYVKNSLNIVNGHTWQAGERQKWIMKAYSVASGTMNGLGGSTIKHQFIFFCRLRYAQCTNVAAFPGNFPFTAAISTRSVVRRRIFVETNADRKRWDFCPARNWLAPRVNLMAASFGATWRWECAPVWDLDWLR